MFCTTCGNSIAPSARFCGSCGAPVPAEAPTAAPVVGRATPGGSTAGRAGARYAGFWRRYAAYIIDALLLLFPVYALLVPMLGFSATTLTEDMADDPARAAIYYVVSLVFAALYPALMHSSSLQATVGKLVFGIKVVDADGGRITFGRALGRYLATMLSALTLCIGFLMAGFTRRRVALHDLIARTRVVSADATPEDVQAGPAPPRLTGGVVAMMVIFFWLPALLVAAGVSVGFFTGSGNGTARVVSAAGDGTDDSRSRYYVDITNDTAYTLVNIYVSPADVDDWEEDLLGDEVLDPGESRRITLTGYDSPLFDIRLVDADGDTYTYYDVDVSEQDIVAEDADRDVGRGTQAPHEPDLPALPARPLGT